MTAESALAIGLYVEQAREVLERAEAARWRPIDSPDDRLTVRGKEYDDVKQMLKVVADALWQMQRGEHAETTNRPG